MSQNGVNWTNKSIVYDVNGNPRQVVTTTYNGGRDTTTVSFSSNGDMAQTTNGINLASYDYYTDKAVQQGDFYSFTSFVTYGIRILSSNHRLKSITNNGFTTAFNYSTDSDGKITQISYNSNSYIQTYTYVYKCN